MWDPKTQSEVKKGYFISGVFLVILLRVALLDSIFGGKGSDNIKGEDGPDN